MSEGVTPDVNIIEYKVAHASNFVDLEREINWLIQAGWQPYGHLIVVGNKVVQVVIKEEMTLTPTEVSNVRDEKSDVVG